MSLNGSDRFSTAEQFTQALKSEFVQQPPDPVTVGSARQDQQAPPPRVEPAVVEEQKPVLPVGVPAATPPPVLPGRKAKTPVPTPVTEPPRAPTTRKSAALLLVLLALIVSVGVGTDRLFSTTGRRNPGLAIPTAAALHKTALPATPVPKKASTTPKPACNSAPPAAVFPSYPVVAKLYTGTMRDIPTDLTTNISLTGIQQQQGAICGNFSKMPENDLFSQIPTNGPFEGTITAAKEIQFILTSDTGQATFSFDGGMQPDGNIAGTYCSLAVVTGKCSDYGLWSVSPEP